MHNTKKNQDYIKKIITHIKKENINIPIGALIVNNNHIISIAKNNNQYGANHAECLAIQKAQLRIQSQSLRGCILYCTLEPCLMCVGAAINAHIKTIYYACKSDKSGIHSYYKMYNLGNINIIHIPEQETEIISTIKTFFLKKRL